jgi:ubiquitin thioesterase OTU1
MRIRVRGPSGMSQVNMADTATWGELKHEISTKTSVPDFDVKYGYPPQNLDTTSIDNDTKLTDVGIKLDGEQLTIMPRDIQQALHNSTSLSSHVDPQNHGTLPSLKNIQPPQHQPGDFPSGQTKGEQAAPLSLQRKPNDVESDPPEVPVPGLEGVLVLRVMPDDNSCMFRALGSAVLGDALDAMNEVRLSNSFCLCSPLTNKLVTLHGGPDDPVKSGSVYCWYARKITRRLLPLDPARGLLGWRYRARHPLPTVRHRDLQHQCPGFAG